MRSARPELRELALLARTPEEGGYNLGAYLSEHAAELAPLLLTTPADLEAGAALTDDQVVVRLRPRLERALAGQQQGQAQRREQEARAAAERLALSVRWDEGRAVLDESILLSRELWAGRNKYAVFVADDFETAVRRDLVTGARAALRTFIDTAAWVDREGLHLAWRAGRGRLNFFPQGLSPADRGKALVIALPGPARVATVRHARRPIPIGDGLADLA